MKTFKVERIQGRAGHEQTLWVEEVEADTAIEAIRLATPASDPAKDFPIDERDSEFAASQDPNAGTRYSDSIIAEAV